MPPRSRPLRKPRGQHPSLHCPNQPQRSLKPPYARTKARRQSIGHALLKSRGQPGASSEVRRTVHQRGASQQLRRLKLPK